MTAWASLRRLPGRRTVCLAPGLSTEYGGRRSPASGAGCRGSRRRRVSTPTSSSTPAPASSSSALSLSASSLAECLLDGAGRAVDEVLRLLEAEAGRRADDLDHLDLLVAGALEHDVEGSLLLRRATVAARRRGSSRDRDQAAAVAHSSSIAFFSSTSSSTVILPSVSSTFAVSVADVVPPCRSVRWRIPLTRNPGSTGSSVSPVAPSPSDSTTAESGPGLIAISMQDRRRQLHGRRPGPGLLAIRAAGSPATESPSWAIRASISPTRSRTGASSRPASWVSGATITPTSWLLTTSGAGELGELLDVGRRRSSGPTGCPREARGPSFPSPCRRAPSRPRRGRRPSRRRRSPSAPRAARATTPCPPPRPRGARRVFFTTWSWAPLPRSFARNSRAPRS